MEVGSSTGLGARRTRAHAGRPSLGATAEDSLPAWQPLALWGQSQAGPARASPVLRDQAWCPPWLKASLPPIPWGTWMMGASWKRGHAHHVSCPGWTAACRSLHRVLYAGLSPHPPSGPPHPLPVPGQRGVRTAMGIPKA